MSAPPPARHRLRPCRAFSASYSAPSPEAFQTAGALARLAAGSSELDRAAFSSVGLQWELFPRPSRGPHPDACRRERIDTRLTIPIPRDQTPVGSAAGNAEQRRAEQLLHGSAPWPTVPVRACAGPGACQCGPGAEQSTRSETDNASMAQYSVRPPQSARGFCPELVKH